MSMYQKHIVFPSGSIRLEGVLHTPEKGAGPVAGVVVCHPHPLYGGEMDNNVVMAICDGLVANGMVALRFNFRGAGGSEGVHDNGKGEQDDVLAALRALGEAEGIDPKRLGLAGYSFGANMVLAAGPRSTAQCLAVVAPAASRAPARLEGLTQAALVLVGDRDPVASVEQVRALAARMGKPAEVHILAGADHSYRGYEDDIASRIGRFFAVLS